MKRVGFISGLSRRSGIAAAVARRIRASHDLMLTGLPAYDAEQATAGPDDDPTALVAAFEESGARAAYVAADLTQPGTPEAVVAAAVERFGGIDTLVAAHAHSRPRSLEALEAETVDRHLAVNVTATLLLVKAFAAAHDSQRGQGRIVLLVSGQNLGPMPAELPYAASKGAVEALVPSLSAALAPEGITVNGLNPGPTDTGLLSGHAHESIRSRFPSGRWGRPEDAARAVDWLTSDDASWVTGQVISSEGGFRR
jgi:3-oxoacyl-[acyl-carrier protein] reductase